MTIQDTLDAICAIYQPQSSHYHLYQEQSIYCEFLHHINGEIKKLAVSLNVIDENMYIYYRDKSILPDRKIFPNVELLDNNNVLFSRFKKLGMNKAVEAFSQAIKDADAFFLQNPVPHSTEIQPLVGNYMDNAGNQISAPTNLVNCRFQFFGKNNRIEIHSDQINLRNVTLECRGNNNKIVIGKNVRMSGHWRLGYRCELSIGKNSTSTNPVYMTIAEGTKVNIGEDCMFATNNQLRTDDAHPIYDVKTGKRVNPPRNITIGNHVWVGYGATVLGGADIGNGSIIGAYALAKSIVPNNSVAVGIPAKVIKKDVFWERENLLNVDIDNGFSEDELKRKWYANETLE